MAQDAREQTAIKREGQPGAAFPLENLLKFAETDILALQTVFG
jgi:hypothetical protein